MIIPILLVTLSVIALAIQVLFANDSRLRTMLLQTIQKDSLQLIYHEMTTQLNNPDVWQKTLELNPEMACVRNLTCTQLTNRPFVVYDGNEVALSGPNALGYTSFGRPCETASAECTVRYTFTWRPVCSDLATCLNPPVEIIGELPPTLAFLGLVQNVSPFRIVIFRQLY